MVDIPSKPENLNALISTLKLTADEKARVCFKIYPCAFSFLIHTTLGEECLTTNSTVPSQTQADLPFKIARVKVAGSFEKQTALTTKYDVVSFHKYSINLATT